MAEIDIGQIMIDNNLSHPLMQAVFAEILARLDLVALKPKRILAVAFDKLQARYPDAEIVATADTADSVDLIISNLSLLTHDDALFKEWRRLLRPQGLLMFTSFGPGTLAEIADQPTQNFIDMHHIGDSLLQAGLVDPVMDAELFEMKYQHEAQVLSDLEKMGITAVNHPPLSLTYEIVYGHAWCPEKKDEFLADSDGVVKIPLSALRARLRQ